MKKFLSQRPMCSTVATPWGLWITFCLSWGLANCLLPVGHFEIACGTTNEKVALDFPINAAMKIPLFQINLPTEIKEQDLCSFYLIQTFIISIPIDKERGTDNFLEKVMN